jgi:hypothetical protein
MVEPLEVLTCQGSVQRFGERAAEVIGRLTVAPLFEISTTEIEKSDKSDDGDHDKQNRYVSQFLVHRTPCFCMLLRARVDNPLDFGNGKGPRTISAIASSTTSNRIFQLLPIKIFGIFFTVMAATSFEIP